MKKRYLLLFLLFTLNVFSQFSKIHYIPPLSGSNNTSSSAQDQYIYISTPNITPVNFTIRQLGSTTISGTVSKSSPYVYAIGNGTSTQLMATRSLVNTVLTDKGYIIEAEDLIYVAVRVTAGGPNQAGALVSKGLAGLGTQFRIGALLNTFANPYTDNHYTFVSVLATENNTVVQFSDIKAGARLINNTAAGNTPAPVTLNSGQSFVMAVEGPLDANRDALIGSLVSSDKPIVVNCGSFTGSNAATNLDLGFDQIVSAERTGKEYIFIKSTGQPEIERVLLVAHTANTEIRLNGNTGAYDYLLANPGDYISLDGNTFDPQGNLYVQTTENVFAYQTVGDDRRTDFANQELFFVPPLSCETPHIIDNIPNLELIGSRIFQGRVTILTESGSTLNFEINGTPYSLASLLTLPGITINGPTLVTTPTQNYDTYTITGLTGNVGVFSSTQLYLAAYGTDGAATFGGFYSGFTFKPEITFNLVNVTQTNCIPNAVLRVNSLSSFDTFQWYFNGGPITGANSNSYNPPQPGYYFVKAAISNCGGNDISSDEIPVSSCPTNGDNDLANDNVDADFDNDGISNCNESLGNQGIDLSNTTLLNVNTTGSAPPAPVPFRGDVTGDFVTKTPIGKDNTVSFKKTFAQPTNIALEYVNSAAATDLLNSNSEFVVSCDINKTITVLNPADQLLIDTNYDDIYESGVTSYSSYEIRFRLNSSVPLAPGTGNFQFRIAATSSFSYIHKNLSDAEDNNATFKLIATCVPRDTDGDGISDAYDTDSDNDGIPDRTEALGTNILTPSNVDVNNDGLDDAFGIGINTADTDADSVPDFIDLDSDNDGIYDLIEAGSAATDANNDGRIDGTPIAFGANGFFNGLETATDSGIINYTIADTDADNLKNYMASDSDHDGCFDVIEAGLTDPDGNGKLGNTPITVNTDGLVTSATGYSILPNNNYSIAAPIAITTQPVTTGFCAYQNTTLTIASTPVNSYQWQVLLGGIWTNVVNGPNYAQSNSNTLQIIAPPFSFNNQQYRVILQRNGNSCNLISDTVALLMYDVPHVNSPVQLIQCDNDNDGFTTVNLRQKENAVTTLANTVYTYYKTQAAATAGNQSGPDYINNPLNYYTNTATIWVRVYENIHGCFSVAQLDVTITATQIPNTFQKKYYKCDDFLDSFGNNNANNNDRDGIATFNFSSVTADILAILPSGGYNIKYYSNFQDASMETDALGNSLEISQNPAATESIYNYRNRLHPNQQQIWVRVESNLDNSCFGLGPYVTLNVETLPIAYPYNADNIIRHCDDDQDGIYAFNTGVIDSIILNGQSGVGLLYFDDAGNPLSSPLPNPLVVNTSKIIRVRAINLGTQAPDGPCYDDEVLQFFVDRMPEAFPVNPNLISVCDDEADPLLQNGLYGFDTASIEASILNGQTGLVVKYFDGNALPLPSPLPNPFITASQNVTALVENPLNQTCPASTILSFKVNTTPQILLHGRYLVCSASTSFLRTIDAAIVDGSSLTNYTFQWYLDGSIIPTGTHYSLNVTAPGIYTVDVTNAQGCMKTRTVEVVLSDVAHIDAINVTDLTTYNSVEIIASGNGSLYYSLDDPDTFQPSNTFYDVSSGIHQVYISDENGCGIVGPIEIYVLGIPKFFTPDGDGVNDFWNLRGGSDKFNKNASIRIFDRHGKFVKELRATDKGWDGTYNGRQLPSEDYWYVIELEDQRILRGHFSLTR